MSPKLSNQSGFVGLVCLLLAIGIVVYIAMIAGTRYFSPAPATKQAIKEAAPGSSVDTSSYTSVLDSTKKQIKIIEQQGLERPNEIMKEMDRMQSY